MSDLTLTTPGGLKWSRTGWPFFLRSPAAIDTQHWSVHCGPTALPGGGLPSKMEWPPTQHAKESEGPTLNWWDPTAELTLLSWRSKWVDVGRQTQAFVTQLAIDAPTDRTSVASLVVLHSGMYYGSGCGFNHAGVAGCSRHRWRHTSATGRGSESVVSLVWPGGSMLTNMRHDIRALCRAKKKSSPLTGSSRAMTQTDSTRPRFAPEDL